MIRKPQGTFWATSQREMAMTSQRVRNNLRKQAAAAKANQARVARNSWGRTFGALSDVERRRLGK